MVVENANGSAGTSVGDAGGGAAGAGEAAGGAVAGVEGAAGGAVSDGDGAAAGTGEGEGGAPKYTPNFKYKVTAPQGDAAARLEKEIPEWARPFITSQDLEKNVRELFEKSEGIEAVKQHRDLLENETQRMRTEWAPIVQNAQTVVGHLQRGDLDSFFEALNIPEATVLKYALYRLQLRENPQALQSHEQMRQLQLQNQQLQSQVQEFSGGYENLAVQQRTMQLDGHLGRPELLPAVQAFDTRVGTPGAFRNEVIKRGKMYASMGQDAPVEQLASEVLQLIGWSGQNSQTQQVAGGAGTGQQTAGGTVQAAKPTFPSIKGKSTSPAKKIIKSTDQLRELARQRA